MRKVDRKTKDLNDYKKTRLGTIPAEWEVKTLGKLGSFLKGKGILKDQLKQTGLPCIRYGEIYTVHDVVIKKFHSFIDKNIAKESEAIFHNDILFAGSGETLEDIGKAVAYVGSEEAYAGGDIVILRTDPANNSEYLSSVLNTDIVNRQKRKIGQGHSVVHIYASDLSGLIVPIPPLPEQQKIARILSTWDKAIEKTEQLIAQKQLLKKGLMQQLLTGKVRFKEFVKSKKMKKTKLGLIPEEWSVISLSEGCTKITDGTHDTPLPTNKGVPFLTAIHVKEGKVHYKDCYYLPHTVHREIYRRCNPEKGDVLFVNIGAGTATAAYVDVDFEFSLKNVALLKPRKEILNGKYLEQYQIFYKKKLEKTYLSGNAQPFLSLKQIGDLLLVLPPLQEQIRIARFLQEINRNIEILYVKRDLMEIQKKGLMQQLLTGKIRVKLN